MKSCVGGELYPFPINLNTLEQFFGRSFTEETARDFLEAEREHIDHSANSEEHVLSRVGRRLYDAFYLGYTLKQWEAHPRELDPSVCGRIPVRFNRDHRYVDQRFQVMPDRGFTAMFRKMLDHPLIRVSLNTDYRDVAGSIRPRRATLYCGPIDAYFDHALGRLPWRSLRFDWRTHDRVFVQPCVQINYPNDFAFTRSVEIKHVTGQQHPKTVIAHEYPERTGDPCYPIPAPEHRALYERYAELSREETRSRGVYFAGRLATYRYINTDQAIEEALHIFEKIREDRVDDLLPRRRCPRRDPGLRPEPRCV